jgi:hypothetical protein
MMGDFGGGGWPTSQRPILIAPNETILKILHQQQC